MDKPEDVVRLDTITVTADVKEELRASMADLYVNIVGSSFFTGSMALKKTKEVNELVTAAAAAGSGRGTSTSSPSAAAASAGVLRRNSSAIPPSRALCDPRGRRRGDRASRREEHGLDQSSGVTRMPKGSVIDFSTPPRARPRTGERIASHLGIYADRRAQL